METEFIYWKHSTSAGVMVEEICGGEDKSAKLWKAMALQVYGENGGDRFREIGHYVSGAPYLEDSDQRISVTHTQHFMAIASLPRTPEVDLGSFNLRTAMGIDAEKSDREQVLKVADRVMTEDEIAIVDEYALQLQKGDRHHAPLEEKIAKVRAYVLAWTIKEALYKAALIEGLDFRKNLKIKSLPEICGFPLASNPRYGSAMILRASTADAKSSADLSSESSAVSSMGSSAGPAAVEMKLFSYESEGHIVTIACSPKAAKFPAK